MENCHSGVTLCVLDQTLFATFIHLDKSYDGVEVDIGGLVLVTLKRDCATNLYL